MIPELHSGVNVGDFKLSETLPEPPRVVATPSIHPQSGSNCVGWSPPSRIFERKKSHLSRRLALIWQFQILHSLYRVFPREIPVFGTVDTDVVANLSIAVLSRLCSVPE